MQSRTLRHLTDNTIADTFSKINKGVFDTKRLNFLIHTSIPLLGL